MTESTMREQILAKEDLPREAVEVPEWGCTLLVRTLMAVERDEFEASYVLDKGNNKVEVDRRNLRAKLVVRCVVNEDGSRLFQDSDVEALGAKSAAAVERLFAVASRLNRLSSQDEAELLKN